MTRLLFGLLLLVLVSGPAFGHGLGDHGNGGTPVAAATQEADSGDETPAPARHRRDPSGSFHHCAVSASCGPLFLFSGASALPELTADHSGWQIAGDVLHRGSVPERDPPVPRV